MTEYGMRFMYSSTSSGESLPSRFCFCVCAAPIPPIHSAKANKKEQFFHLYARLFSAEHGKTAVVSVIEKVL